MAKVYITKKVEELIEPYRYLLPKYHVLDATSKTKNGYIVLCEGDSADMLRHLFFNTCGVFVVADNWHYKFANSIKNEPKDVALLIQSLCCSSYQPFEYKRVQIRCSDINTIPNVQSVNKYNQYREESLLLNLRRFVFCSTFVTLSTLIYISISNKVSILSNQTYEQAMPLCMVAYMIYGLSLVFNYVIEKNKLKKKCKFIKNKGNVKNLYYISNEIEGIDFE